MARDCTGWQRFPTPLGMADTEPQEVVPGAPGNDLMNALRHDSAPSRTRHPWLPDVLPRSHPPDAYLQNPARARQERPIGQDRQPRTHAPRACLTIALTCILTGLTLSACSLPCAPPPARQSLPGSKRLTSARQGKACPAQSGSTIQLLQHLTATLDPAPQVAQHRGRASSSEQQQQQRAAATAANSSNNSEQQQRAAGASSSEQQQHRAASNSSREQQQQRAAAAIAAAVANSTYPPVHPYVHISHSVTSMSNECQAPYHTSYTYQVNKSQPRLTNFAATISFPPKVNQNEPSEPKNQVIRAGQQVIRAGQQQNKMHACSEKTHPISADKFSQKLPSTTPIPQHQALTRQHHTKQNTTSPPSPTGRLWDHPPLRG